MSHRRLHYPTVPATTPATTPLAHAQLTGPPPYIIGPHPCPGPRPEFCSSTLPRGLQYRLQSSRTPFGSVPQRETAHMRAGQRAGSPNALAHSPQSRFSTTHCSRSPPLSHSLRNVHPACTGLRLDIPSAATPKSNRKNQPQCRHRCSQSDNPSLRQALGYAITSCPHHTDGCVSRLLSTNSLHATPCPD